jgi:hypothetical protein
MDYFRQVTFLRSSLVLLMVSVIWSVLFWFTYWANSANVLLSLIVGCVLACINVVMFQRSISTLTAAGTEINAAILARKSIVRIGAVTLTLLVWLIAFRVTGLFALAGFGFFHVLWVGLSLVRAVKLMFGG